MITMRAVHAVCKKEDINSCRGIITLNILGFLWSIMLVCFIFIVMEEKITAWIARDKSNEVYLYLYKPHRNPKGWWYIETDKCKMLDKTIFPNVKWEDKEPTKVELTIKICE